MLLGLTDALPVLVEAKYKAAKAAASLIFSPTELAVIRTTSSVPFQLRYCPALAKKPTPEKDRPEVPSKKPDPFDDPPEQLLIAHVPRETPTHLLVLNKYPVIAEHFILATRVNKAQTHLLEQDDLEAAYACMEAWESAESHCRRRRLFTFFNSGDHSGASQAHRHLQFLPVENMGQGHVGGSWKLLIDEILAAPGSIQSAGLRSHPGIPFAHFGAPLPPDPTADQLHELYMKLYEAAAAAVREYIKSHPGNLELHSTEGGSAPISYNLALTTSAMAICPRKRTGDVLRQDDGSEVGSVELNGTVLAGTLMVKAEREWELLKGDATKFDFLLAAVGIPQSVSGTSDAIKL